MKIYKYQIALVDVGRNGSRIDKEKVLDIVNSFHTHYTITDCTFVNDKEQKNGWVILICMVALSGQPYVTAKVLWERLNLKLVSVLFGDDLTLIGEE